MAFLYHRQKGSYRFLRVSQHRQRGSQVENGRKKAVRLKWQEKGGHRFPHASDAIPILLFLYRINLNESLEYPK